MNNTYIYIYILTKDKTAVLGVDGNGKFLPA